MKWHMTKIVVFEIETDTDDPEEAYEVYDEHGPRWPERHVRFLGTEGDTILEPADG
jgi:hypothetical protein